MNPRGEISALISTATTVAAETEASFGQLRARQLNWKPDAKQWSIAQCLDHLATANESYFPTFDKVLNGETTSVLGERLPWLAAFWGKMLIKTVSPETARKSKAPKIFRPARSSLDRAIVRRFLDRQDRLIRYLRAAGDLDSEKIIIPSPVTGLIFYSLRDACRLIVAHEKRHLLQARRVSEMRGFPDGLGRRCVEPPAAERAGR